MSGLSEEQIQYLRDVLGVDSVVLGRQAPGAVAAAPPPAPSEMRVKGDPARARLLVFAAGEREFVLSGEAGELAAKMIQAMKLAADDVAIVEWTSSVPDDVRDLWSTWSGLALSFGELAAAQLTSCETVSGSWVEDGSRKLMVTDSPARLLRETERKKVAWAHLQQVMKALA